MTTTAIPTEPQTEDEEFEEPENAVLRRELGLRPIHHPQDGPHPDQRPCPSWCWISHYEEYEHEVDWGRPLDAVHRQEVTPSVAASLYPGEYVAVGGTRCVHVATIEPRLEQVGQTEPVINVAMRRYEKGEQKYEDEFLRLAITDARELVTALNYLIETADRA